jgi:hypothetical protein
MHTLPISYAELTVWGWSQLHLQFELLRSNGTGSSKNRMSGNVSTLSGISKRTVNSVTSRTCIKQQLHGATG